MSYINRLWRSYLAGEGYSLADVNNMIKRALEAETGETGDINSLWMKYLSAQGYADGDINSRMMQWLGAKGYSGSIDTRLRQALEAGDIFAAAAACTITLTGDIAAGAGGQPMTISGQTASYTLNETPTLWLATTNPADLYVKPTDSAIPITELAFSATGYAQPVAALSSVDLVTMVSVQKIGAGYLAAINDGSGIVAVNSGSITSSDVIAMGVDSSGTPVVYVNGTPIEWLDVQEYDPIAPPAIFASVGYMFLAAQLPDVHTEGSGSITFRTAGTDFTQTYPADTLDWCGDEIPDGPYAYRLNASEALIAASAPGTEKMVPSADEQTGTTTLTFTGSNRQIALTGNVETESPLAINYLNDMSYGTGDFVYELHIDWPELTGGSVTGTISSYIQLTNGAGGANLQMGSTLGPAGGSNILTAWIWDDTGEGVKKYSFWKDGVNITAGLVIGAQVAVGIDMSQLFAFMYTQEGANTLGTEGEFVDPSPQIITRLVTDPAEMVYAQTVLPQTAQTIIGNGQVVIP